MFTKLIWQVRQFFVSFPHQTSWAYALHMWWYDVNLRLPAKDGVTFPTAFNELKYPTKEVTYENSFEDILDGPDGPVIGRVDSDGRIHNANVIPKDPASHEQYGITGKRNEPLDPTT